MQAQQQQKGAQGGYGSPLPDLPKQDPMQNTMEWQNHGYGMDSGIQSGATTQAPSVTSAHSHKSHHDDEVLSGFWSVPGLGSRLWAGLHTGTG